MSDMPVSFCTPRAHTFIPYSRRAEAVSRSLELKTALENLPKDTREVLFLLLQHLERLEPCEAL